MNKLSVFAVAACLAFGAVTVASAQNTGQGASKYAPGHSTTNIPPGQGGVKGATWTPPGQKMKQTRAMKPKAATASVKKTKKTKKMKTT